MIDRFKIVTCLALVVAAHFSLSSATVAADLPANDTRDVKQKPTGVLANAANAAAAAANAANAAANAANAAAAAATAALDAINSIIPSNGRVFLPEGVKAKPATPPPNLMPQLADVLSTPPAKETQNQPSSNVAKFSVPEERSLVGLIGKFEIPVFVDKDGELAKSLAGYQSFDNEPISESNETNLTESINAGRGFNRDTLVAGARADQAKAQTGQALALLLPSVSVRASSGWETSTPSVALDPATGKAISSDTHSRTDASLVVRQPLFDLPSYFDWRRREVIEQSRNESYRASDGDAYVSTVNAYLSLVSSRLQADLTRDFEEQLKELLVYIEKRAAAGAASVSDMARVRARRQSAISSRLEQESAHAAAGIEFVRLTNRKPKMVRLPDLNDIGAPLLPESLDYAVTMAMLQNPEIASLASEVQAAKIDKSAAKSRFLPRVNLEFSENYSLHAGGDTSAAGQRDRRIMMVMDWNLFSGGSDYRYHDERAARKVELKYRLDDQRRRIAQTLSANYGTIASTKERLEVGYSELKSISVAAEAMSKRMLSGNQSLLDLLDVYDRHYQARVRLVNLHILEMSTVAQAVRLVKGGPDAKTSTPIVITTPKEEAPKIVEKPATVEAPAKAKE